MNGYEILKRIIGDDCIAEDITEEDVRTQAELLNEQEERKTGEIIFSEGEIEEAIKALEWLAVMKNDQLFKIMTDQNNLIIGYVCIKCWSGLYIAIFLINL